MVQIKNFFGTTWCSDCKRAKMFLSQHRISYNWIDIELDEVSAQFVEKINDGKRRVPTIEFDDGSFLVVPSNAELAKKLNLVSKPKHKLHDILIIGGGPAGLTCALYAAREGFDTALVEKSALGGQVGVTDKLDNYPGFPDGISGMELAERFARQAERFNVEIIRATEIVEVICEGEVFVARTSTGDEIDARAVVVATGSTYKRLWIPGEDELLGYKIHFCSTCDAPFYKGKEVVVIGGGNSAFEESMFIARFASKVTIVGRSNAWKASAILQQNIAEKDNIILLKNKEAKEFLVGPKKTLNGVIFLDKEKNKEITMHPDGVFVFIGLKPNVEIVKELVDTDSGGFIVTRDTMMTRTPGLFAAGDCRAGSIQQAASAAGEGAAVALMARNYLRRH
ncbi:MAG: FAD-dependent oxidoreductase [Asgard group archaeon]|nr:FAD-dependent oxidoreductase [Asgard group archaeon]